MTETGYLLVGLIAAPVLIAFGGGIGFVLGMIFERSKTSRALPRNDTSIAEQNKLPTTKDGIVDLSKMSTRVPQSRVMKYPKPQDVREKKDQETFTDFLEDQLTTERHKGSMKYIQ